jgi:hypothetical protein
MTDTDVFLILMISTENYMHGICIHVHGMYGQDGISAINLMEFNSRMDKARNAHKDCVQQLKLFWSRAVHFAPQRGRFVDEPTVCSLAHAFCCLLIR